MADNSLQMNSPYTAPELTFTAFEQDSAIAAGEFGEWDSSHDAVIDWNSEL